MSIHWRMLLVVCFVAEVRAQHVPLCPGLKVVTAAQQPDGDYESIKTVQALSADEGQGRGRNRRVELLRLQQG